MATKINYKILKLLLHDHLWDCRSDSAFRSQGELTVACKCHWCGRQLRTGSKTSWKHSFRSIVRTETLSLHVLDCMWHRSQSSSLSLFSLHLTIKHLSIRCLQLIRQVLCHQSHTIQITTNYLDRTHDKKSFVIHDFYETRI